MRRLLWTLLIAAQASAVIVDRVEISVANKVITESDIDLRIRLSAFQNGVTPDFSLASRKEAANRLIDQRLVEHEMDLGHYPRPAPTRGTELLTQYAGEHYGGDLAAMREALARYRLTANDLAQDLLDQSSLLTFLNLRFRPGVEAPQADADLNNWLADQRNRTKIDYVDPELKP